MAIWRSLAFKDKHLILILICRDQSAFTVFCRLDRAVSTVETHRCRRRELRYRHSLLEVQPRDAIPVLHNVALHDFESSLLGALQSSQLSSCAMMNE